MYVFDTNFMINFFRDKKRNNEIIETLINTLSDMYITSMNWYELVRGCHLSNNYQKNYEFISIIPKSGIKFLDFDDKSANIAAKIYSDLRKKGELIDENDILIAAICVRHNFTLITENIKYFSKIKDLKLYNY